MIVWSYNLKNRYIWIENWVGSSLRIRYKYMNFVYQFKFGQIQIIEQFCPDIGKHASSLILVPNP